MGKETSAKHARERRKLIGFIISVFSIIRYFYFANIRRISTFASLQTMETSKENAQMAELVDALVSNTSGKPCRFDPGSGYKTGNRVF